MKNQPVKERFMEKVCKDSSTGCWNFTSSIGSTNCGRFFYNGKCRDAYRIGYFIFVKKLSKSQHLHHVCENRRCVNPEHLQVTTPSEHFGDLSPTHIAFKNKHKTHCKKGHPFTKNNLVKYRLPNRLCLICSRAIHRIYSRNYRKKHK